MHSSCIEHFVIRAKLMDLNELELIGVTHWKASSQLPICLLQPQKQQRLTWTQITGSWPRDDLTNLNSRSMLEPYTSGSIGAAKNDNSGLAGLEIYLAPPKGGEASTVSCIHIRTRHVSFSILIGRNSVAEWLIVASTYHLNSDPK